MLCSRLTHASQEMKSVRCVCGCVLWESVGGRDVRMWSGCVCGTVDVAAGEYMYGACLMVVVLVGVLLVRERKQTGLSLVWIFLSAVQQTEATHGLLPRREEEETRRLQLVAGWLR